MGVLGGPQLARTLHTGSAKSEYYIVVRYASEALRLTNTIRELGDKALKLHTWTDSCSTRLGSPQREWSHQALGHVLTAGDFVSFGSAEAHASHNIVAGKPLIAPERPRTHVRPEHNRRVFPMHLSKHVNSSCGYESKPMAFLPSQLFPRQVM